MLGSSKKLELEETLDLESGMDLDDNIDLDDKLDLDDEVDLDLDDEASGTRITSIYLETCKNDLFCDG